MTQAESALMVSKLKGLYPKMGAEQISFWAVNFVQCEHDVVSDCIDKLARLYGPEECPSRPILLGMIQTENQKTGREQSFADQERRKQREREVEAEIVARKERADQFAASLPDERLIELRDELMACSTSHLRALLGHRDPRQSPMLRDLIYAHVEETERVGG